MSEKPEALEVADSVEFCPQPYSYAAARLLREQHAEIERLRGLLREAREYLPEHHPIAESLFPRIDQALQEVPIDLNAEWGLAVDASKEPATQPAIRAQEQEDKT